MAAARDVAPMTAFLYIPQELMINDETIKIRAPQIWEVFEKYPQVFKRHYDAEYLRIILYVWYEQEKGRESFWYPYFQIVNYSDLPMLWEPSEIEQLQDRVLESQILTYRREFELEWEEFYTCLKENRLDWVIPGISDPENATSLRLRYIRAFNTVVTRCFGWGIPCTTLIPFADCINHHNVDSSYDVIKAEWEPISLKEKLERFPEKDDADEEATPSVIKLNINPWLLDEQNPEEVN